MNLNQDNVQKHPLLLMNEDFLKRTGASREAVGLCIRLLQNNLEKGDTCLELTEEERQELLREPALVSDNGLFVLDGNRFFTRRNWNYERKVLQKLSGMTQKIADNVTIPEREIFSGLYPCQKAAVKLICENRFSILTGGPGTGKTYTIARAVRLAMDFQNNLKIGLAAPTGKAAARINETMEVEIQNLHLEGVEKATTIHTMLGMDHTGVSFKHNAGNPLDFGWIIIDEASMVDLPLMAKLLDALPEGCRLTLVGDANQLASVEAGRVFGDLRAMPEWHDYVAELTESARFKNAPEIFLLAEAIKNRQPQEVMQLLSAPGAQSVHYYPHGQPEAPYGNNETSFSETMLSCWRDFSTATTAESALELLNQCRVLCALHKGRYGTDYLNDFIRKRLPESSPVPMMITRNDFPLEVANGDVGVVMPEERDSLYLMQNGQIRKIPLALLPFVETSFATTIHKSQGSEFDNVFIVLPPLAEEPDNDWENSLTRELLYTAVTRARRQVFLAADKIAIRKCCLTETVRSTGLSRH